MLALYRDPHYTFRFADNRIVPRFRLEGARVGQPVAVFRIDPATGERRELLTTGVVGGDGWVDVAAPITVRAGDEFVAVPGEAGV